MERQYSGSINNEQQFDIRNGVLFRYNGNDVAVSIPSSVRTISSLAFRNCGNISSIYVPDTVTRIDDYAFAHCSSLKCMTLGFGVRNIPKGCFSGLRELETVILTDNIESFCDFAFDNCSSLKSLNFITKKYRAPITPTEKGKAYEAMLLGGKAQIEYIDYTDAVPTIKNVGKYAFRGCSSFVGNTLKSAVKIMGVNAFEERIKQDNAVVIGVEQSTSSAAPETNVDIFTESKPTTNNTEYGQSNKTDNSLDDVQIEKKPLQVCDQHCLIEGYAVVGDNILNCATGQTVPDRSISGLDIDFASTLILRRAGQLYGDTITLSQILQIRLEQLTSVKRATPVQIRKAEKQLRELLESLFDPCSVEQPGNMLYSAMPVKVETVATENDVQDNTERIQCAEAERDETTSDIMLKDTVICESQIEDPVQENCPSEQVCTDTPKEGSREEPDEIENEQSENVENDGDIPVEVIQEIAAQEDIVEDINQETCLPEPSDTVTLVDEPEMAENEQLSDASPDDAVDDNFDIIANKSDLPEKEGIAVDGKMPEYKSHVDTGPEYLIDGYAVADGKIVNCSTGVTISDQNISDRDMDPMSIIILRRAGKIYCDAVPLSQVLRIHPKQLWGVKRVNPAQVEKTIRQLTKMIESLFVRNTMSQDIAPIVVNEDTGDHENATVSMDTTSLTCQSMATGDVESGDSIEVKSKDTHPISDNIDIEANIVSQTSSVIADETYDEDHSDEIETGQRGNSENDGGIPVEVVQEIAVQEDAKEDINKETCSPEPSDTVTLADEPAMAENEELPDASCDDSMDDNFDIIEIESDLPEKEGIAVDVKMPEYRSHVDTGPECLIDGYAVTDGKIVDCSTGRTIPDQYISNWDMDPTSIIILRRAGGIYSDSLLLSQVLQLHLSQLQSVRNAKAAQVENTLDQLKGLLGSLFAPRIVMCKSVAAKVANEAIMHGCDANAYSLDIEQSAAIAENENDRQNKCIPSVYLSEETSEDLNSLTSNTEEAPLCAEIDLQEQHEPLISGFDVIDGAIFRTDTQQRIEDAPIAVLNLSTRAYNCLGRTRAYTTGKREEVMISTVLGHTPAELRNIRNMGAKTADEITEKIGQYLLTHSGHGESNTKEIKNTLAPNYEIIDGIITNVVTQRVVPDVSVYDLNLSTRAGGSLYRGEIRKLSELIVLTEQQLQNFSNLGSKSVAEIIECVPAYLKAHEEEKKEIDIDHSTTNDADPVLVLPEINPDIPVLAAEYAVVDGMIICRSDHSRIADASIEVLNLSVRATNCLERSGLTKLSMLIGLPYSEFRNIRNLGALSANEIQEKLELYLSRCCSVAESDVSQGAIYSSGDILSVLKEHEYESLSLGMICEALPNANEEDILQLVEHLLRDGSIEKDGNTYNVFHRSFVESISTLAEDASLDARDASVLQLRSNGLTLEEVGNKLGVTRERVRQIEKKAMDKLTRRGRVHFEEDKYAYFFTTYTIDKELFFDYLQETEQVWYYLSTRYRKGKEELSKAIDDPNVSVELRRIADRYTHRGYIQVDGVYIPALRGDIEDYVVEKYCKDEVSIDEFFLLYDKFLQANDITDERFQVTESTRATRSNRLSESNKILWKQNQRFRYYDIQSGDYTELLEVLDLSQYTDIELSTRKFLMDHPELMSRYDLRDEYEIHNLLKKVHAKKDNPDMIFSRMPNIIFGVFDRDAAVKEMLFALAPISQDDLADAISEEYGTRAETIKANWLTGISEYYHQGMYSVDYEDMPEDHVKKLQTVLTEDFYYLAELRKIYSRAIPGADMSLLSTYNLKKMGFLIGSSYVLQNYPTAEAYFDHLLTEKDVVDIEPISKRYTSLTTYSVHLADLKHEMEIIEFEPYQYINIRRLRKLGYDKNRLRAYVDRVWSFLVNDEYFTIQSLKNAGFEDELDVLGFDDLFYSSLLREDSRFSWQRVGKAVVLNPKRTQFTVHDFLVDRVTKEKSVDVDDFVAMLQDEYGIIFERQDILTHVKGSDVYYDSIMGKLYADYATYFEEV